VSAGEGKRAALDKAIAGALDDARQRHILANKCVEMKLDAAVASASGLSFPGKVTAAPARDGKAGYVFIADSSHNAVVVATWPEEADGRAMSRFVWRIGGGKPGTVDGAVAAARFNDPQGLAFDAAKRVLYVADTKNHSIRTIDIGALESGEPSTAPVVGTLVGTGNQVNDRAGGKAGRDQGLSSPWDVVLGPDSRTLFVAMAGTHQIWSVDLETKVARVFAGSGAEDLQDGSADAAALAQPSGLSVSSDGSRLYFADSEVSAVRSVDLKTMTVSTIVGHGLFDFGDVSNTLVRSRFQHCLGVAVWPQAKGADRVIVADTYNHKVKVIDQATQRVSELLGVGRVEKAKDATDLVLDEPGGVSLASFGEGARLFIADTNNHRVIVADPATTKWGELVIDGLEGAGDGQHSSVKAASVSVSAAPGRALKLRLAPPLPADSALNTEAPIGIRVWRVGSEGSLATIAQRTLRAAALPVSVEIPASAIEPGARFRVEMSFASCLHGDEGVCTPGEAAWEVLVDRGDATEATLQ
jgi:DNA-binding beta-propeller fold protein YncE